MSDAQTPAPLELAQKKGQPKASPNAQTITAKPTTPTAAQVEAQARKVAAKAIREGFALLAVHEYTAADGQPLYWKIRAKHEGTGDKFIRAFHWTGSTFKASEPAHPLEGKPLYGLHGIAQADPAAVVWITEGEQKSDALAALGLIATTTGGSSSANKSDWQPLAGRPVVVWPDHDEPGQKYAAAVASILQAQGCTVSVVRVSDLEGMPPKGDVVDWLAMREAAGLTTTAADVEGLPRDLWQPEPEQPLPSFARIAAAPASLPPQIEELMTLAAADVGMLWEPEALEAIRALYDSSPAQWARLRVRLKAMKDLKLSDYEKSIVPTGDKEAEQNHAAMLITLAAEHCQFIHDADMTGYALLSTNDVRQCHRLDSTAFGEWLSYQFYKAEGTAPSDYALKAAIASMTGKAKFEGDLHEVHTRTARHDGAYWLDLCNDQWQAVRITRDGWQVIDRPPVLFTRSANMRPLPTPQAGQGDITALWPAVNVPETERLNVLAWLIECLRPETPFVVLELSGEHGSAKSGTARVLRDLIDPNKSNLRAAPKSKDDLFVVARNAHVLSLENLSHLSSEYQDALCTLATGGGYAARTLYTNGEETCFEIKKPIILNGIPSVVTASDLSSRTLHMELPVIKQGRMTEEEIKAYWQAHQAIAFAGLLDTFAQVLAELERVQHDRKALGELPRMADFCLLGEAVYRVHGLPAGAFIAYDRARIAESAQRTLEGSPVAMAMIEWLKANPTGYEGTVKGLLEQLDRLCLDTPASAWPKSPKGLGDIIQRVKPALRLIGIELHKEAKNRRDGVWCTLRYAPKDNPKPQQAAAKGAVGELGELGELCPPTANTTQKQAANPCQTGGCELGELGELENKPFAPEHTYTPPAPAKTANGYALNSGFGSHAATTSKPEGWEGDL